MSLRDNAPPHRRRQAVNNFTALVRTFAEIVYHRTVSSGCIMDSDVNILFFCVFSRECFR